MKISLVSACLFTALFVASTSAQIVSKKALEQDLAYTVKTVAEVHPALVNGELKQVLEAKAASLTQALPAEVPRWRVGVTVAELLRVVNDAHTSTDPTFGSSRYLPLSFAWLSDGLIVAPVTGSKVKIPVASEVLKIGDLNTEALERRLSRLVSESRYSVRESGAGSLPAESVLRWLHVVQNDAVMLMIRTPSGLVETVKVGLTDYELVTSRELDERLREARELSGGWRVMNDILAWRVDKSENYGLFWLRHFVVTPEYRAEVQRVFEEVSVTGVGNVVFSVQQNGGGDSSLMYSLMAHLPNRRFRSFSGHTRFSPAALQALGLTQAQFDEAARKHQVSGLKVDEDVYKTTSENEVVLEKAPIFTGKVYILIDSASFSSAVDTATVLSDNHVATLVGEATGGMPTSYGDYLEFTTPNLNLPLRVSYKHFVRPDPSRDPANTLTPDIPLPVTVKDVQTGHSPIKVWLEGLARAHPRPSRATKPNRTHRVPGYSVVTTSRFDAWL